MRSATVSLVLFGFLAGSLTSLAATRYVALDGSNVAPYASWATAATNIPVAVAGALDGDTILVSSGRYIVGTAGDETSGSGVMLTNAIVLAAVFGPAVTTIDALGWHKRCVYLGHPGAVLRGFTLEGGYARINLGAQTFPVSCGGGVFCDGGGLVENCVVSFGRAGLQGGAAFLNGGGELRSCLLRDSEAPESGGVFCSNGGAVVNCTVVGNWTQGTNLPGGAWLINGGRLLNSIVVYNSNNVGTTADVHTQGGGWQCDYSCVNAGMPGTGNISTNPVFSGWRLQRASPCRNAGTNLPWMTSATDVEGSPRILEEIVDMGAYETPAFYYVATNGGQRYPYTSWAMASTNIADALRAATPQTTVLVSNGVYTEAAVLIPGTNITLQSVAGAAVTTIRGGPGRRCLDLRYASTVVAGFTLTGTTLTNAIDASGAGVRMTQGTLRECVVAGNTAWEAGGGISMAGGLVQNCLVYSNAAPQFGGGVALAGGLLENCIIRNNRGGWAGGGLALQGAGTARSCLIVSNLTPADPIPDAGNMRTGGGGIFALSMGTLENCTIAANLSSNDAGGIFCIDFFGGGTTTLLVNTILYGNTAVAAAPNYTGGTLWFEHGCLQPAPAPAQDGGGNLALDPLFAGGFQLTFLSPCRDTGMTQAWMISATDLAGNPRMTGASVDMGAYEFVPEPWLAAAPLVALLCQLRRTAWRAC
ncbi:MAG: hypothetical protein NTV22_13430 [bacterium]|nr:hypothetical protein [bacterium]